MTDEDVLAAVQKLPARTVAALTLYGECRGESLTGQIAVAWVIKNRAASRRQTIAEVCFAKWQFSCWWEIGPNRNALIVRARTVLTGPDASTDDAAWLQCLRVAHDVLEGAEPDPTGGAQNYLTTALYNGGACPGWAHTCQVTATIGAHVFLRDRRG